MARVTGGTWDQVRQSFADQFETAGANFIYRRSQKGEAIRVSADEYRKFLDDFNRSLRLETWIIYLGFAVVFGGLLLLMLTRGFDLNEAAIFAALAVVMIPYFIYFRWAWAAPARALAGRMPIAGERSSDEVRRLRFQRITYGNLAIAAASGVGLPFLLHGRQDVFSGWGRIWLFCGGALVLFAAVQAFRKWQTEQDSSPLYVPPPRP